MAGLPSLLSSVLLLAAAGGTAAARFDARGVARSASAMRAEEQEQDQEQDRDSEPVGPVEGLLDGDAKKAVGARRVARTDLAACIDPTVEPDLLGPTPWLDELKNAVDAAASGMDSAGGSPHTQSIWRPLDTFVDAGWLWTLSKTGNFISDKGLPYHRAIALTSNRSQEVPPGLDYAESRCFLFDYDAAPGSVPDPHGCGLFRQSFSRLKELRQCIVGELEASEKWQQYRRFIRLDAPVSDEEVEAANHIRKVINRNINPTYFDANSRADEMVKYVAFKDWSRLSGGLIQVVSRKIAEAVNEVVLEPETVDSVRIKCFKVEQDSYKALPAETQALKRALPCQTLMWDTSEVAGPPQKPMSNGALNFDLRLRAPATVKADFNETPPVCGRIALALSQRIITHAPKGYSPKECIAGQMSWDACLGLTTFNCICAEKCWVAALKLACRLSPGCCGDHAKIKHYDNLVKGLDAPDSWLSGYGIQTGQVRVPPQAADLAARVGSLPMNWGRGGGS